MGHLNRLRPLAAIVFITLVAGHAAAVTTTVLHDASANGGAQTPADSGFFYLPNPPVGPDATQSAAGELTTLKTTIDRSEQAGYFSHSPINGAQAHPAAPTLKRTPGFTLSFDLAVVSEGHDTRDDNGDSIDDRAGFSVIVISDDLKGVELGFWDDEIWAYEDDSPNPANLFTHAEGVTRNTAAMTRYDLTIVGDSYELFADGQSILTGDVRDYTNWPGIPISIFGNLDPYEQANMIFLGDDTSSADSEVQIGDITVTNLPEPASVVLLLLGSVMMVGRKVFRRQ